MRVVFDTNIFVSAIIFPEGRAAEAMHRVIAGRDRLIISPAIVEELLGVLARKFARDLEQLARLAVFIGDLGERVAPTSRLKVLKDDPDNRVLECAVTGRADAIVTGDRAMLAIASYRRIRLLSLADYLSE